MRAAIITRHGDPEALTVEDVEVPVPRPGHVLVRVDAAGLNFHDVIERRSGYPGQAHPPLRTGLEGAGTVAVLGDGVSELSIGSRVMWGFVPGSHAEFVEVPVDEAVPVPRWVDPVHAAAVCAQGLTAHYLVSSLREFRPGDTALVWAAAGGVGRLLTQMLTAKEVRVLAACSSPEKVEAAREAGAHRCALNADVAGAVAEMTESRGVDVVFDGVGGPTFDTSLASVRRRGLLVVYGRAGGDVPPIDLGRLSAAGSVSLVRPRLVDFTASREELLSRAQDVFDWLQRGVVTVRVDATFTLDDIAEAHRLLESRGVIGKVVIQIPSPAYESDRSDIGRQHTSLVPRQRPGFCSWAGRPRRPRCW